MFREGDYESVEAAADLSTKRFYIVKLDANGKAILATAATDAILGVLNNEAKLGSTADVRLINGSGSYQVIAGGTIAKDAYITTDANGKAVATSTAGNRVMGRAKVAAVANDIFEAYQSNEKV